MADDKLAKILMPMIRQVLPQMIAQDIIGVQPMSGAGLGYFGKQHGWQRSLEFMKWYKPEEAYEKMQYVFPGPYTLKQHFDKEKDSGYYYTLEWEDEAERTMWILKNT
jgi:hypothetical protein